MSVCAFEWDDECKTGSKLVQGVSGGGNVGGMEGGWLGFEGL